MLKISCFSLSISILFSYPMSYAVNLNSCSNLYLLSHNKTTAAANDVKNPMSGVKANFDPKANIEDAWALYEKQVASATPKATKSTEKPSIPSTIQEKKTAQKNQAELPVLSTQPSLVKEIDTIMHELSVDANVNTTRGQKRAKLDELDLLLQQIIDRSNSKTTKATEESLVHNLEYLMARFMKSDFANVENSAVIFGHIRRVIKHVELSDQSIYSLKEKIFLNSVAVSRSKKEYIFSQYFIHFLFDRWQDGTVLKTGSDRILTISDLAFMETVLEYLASYEVKDNGFGKKVEILNHVQLEVIVVILQDVLRYSNLLGSKTVQSILKNIHQFLTNRIFTWEEKQKSYLLPVGLTVQLNGKEVHPQLAFRDAIKYLLIQLTDFAVISANDKEYIMSTLQTRGTPGHIRDASRELLKQLEDPTPN